MQTEHNSAAKLEALAPGQAFRFYFRAEAAIGLKVQFTHGARGDAALVLTPTEALQSGALLSGYDVGDVVALPSAMVVPSSESGTVTPGKGHIAQPGEIELHGRRLIFVTKPHDGTTYRVDLQSGDIGLSSGIAPTEIYAEWSIQDRKGTLHEHKPTPSDPAEYIVVAVE